MEKANKEKVGQPNRRTRQRGFEPELDGTIELPTDGSILRLQDLQLPNCYLLKGMHILPELGEYSL